MQIKTKATLTSVTLLSLLALMSGCASDLKVTTLAPVGPDSGHVPGERVPGFLVVYTATENPINTSDGGVMYYPHTSYTIFDSHGAKVRWVANHISSSDESPSHVSLPAGNYIIRAESEMEGAVAVPVVVKEMRTTVVNLEKRSHGNQAS